MYACADLANNAYLLYDDDFELSTFTVRIILYMLNVLLNDIDFSFCYARPV